MILVVVNDLFFGERLQIALRHLGLTHELVDLSNTPAPAVHPNTELAIVDLEAGEPALHTIRSASQAGVKVLAFGPHTDLALRQGALAAGATQVVAKSKLTTSLPELIAALTH